MASSNVASSPLPYASGNVVAVAQVLPVAPGGGPPVLDGRYRFRKGHLQTLGTVQVMIGVTTLLFGLAGVFHQLSLGVISGIFVWGALIYIASGSVTVAADKYLSHCLVKTSLALNIFSALVAASGVVLYALDPVSWSFQYNDYYPGYSVVVAVFHFLELVVSVTVAAFACHGTCGCCTEQPQVYIQTVDNLTATQAPPPFPAASSAPAQLYPQTELNFQTQRI